MGEGHRKRLKQKYIDNGIHGLSDVEVLELILFYAVPRKDTNPLAKRLLNRFENLWNIVEAPVSELEKVEGLGDGVFLFLRILKDFALLHSSQKKNIGKYIGISADIGYYLLDKYSGYKIEIVILICLNARQQIISEKIISKGNDSSVNISLTTIVEEARKTGSSIVILAHNHPSGLAIPSYQDVKTTRQLHKDLRNLKITLLDHIIFEAKDFISMYESDLFSDKDFWSSISWVYKYSYFYMVLI